jgi:predicted RNA-binding protein with TRAM domain
MVTTQRFETTLWRPDGEGTSTFIPVPLDVRATFGRARPPVLVTVNGYTYRSTIAVYGGHSYLPVNREHREKAGVAPGDTVTVELTSDADSRQVHVPDDLQAALDGDSAVRARFDALSYSHRREYVIWVEGAKRPETRKRRISQTVQRLGRGERLKS